jgi:copper homeostasis protein
MGPLIEICVEGIDGLLTAQAAGADRVELCASLLEGGLTPSIGTIKTALARATIPFYPIIRPRGGDFLYSEPEFATMQSDIETLRALGVKGVVFGILTADARIDEPRMRALVEAAGPMDVTCHRAFDMTRDLGEALEALIRCGVKRVLTSGQRDTAVEGLDNLKRTVALAAGRIKVMVCGALDASNIVGVRDATQAPEMHFAALTDVASGMNWHNPHVGMGGVDKEREYMRTVSDRQLIHAAITAAKS